MIAALILVAVVGWSCWLMHHAGHSPQGTTPLAAQAPRISRTPTVLGLEDDPDQWRPTRGAWTALDECQLIRLLTDSAPISRRATNVIDGAIPQPEKKDTA